MYTKEMRWPNINICPAFPVTILNRNEGGLSLTTLVRLKVIKKIAKKKETAAQIKELKNKETEIHTVVLQYYIHKSED